MEKPINNNVLWLSMMDSALQQVLNVCRETPDHTCETCPAKLICGFTFGKQDCHEKMKSSIEKFQEDVQVNLAHAKELVEESPFNGDGVLECTSEDCAYNHDGVCRFHLVHERPPVITEEDGCTEGVFDLLKSF